ncbi:hypothetical protein E1A91_A09G202000v1 [Gossypium mustelinum]|uniref:Uncharacterized protein n=1 Tax=Gossypium mustelinum TaxID=34275 RepID=A0A5D2Y020_GOSMU|nr:hypothetical protein E1A91_A09G202000v1 [Gossypium mustelinum]
MTILKFMMLLLQLILKFLSLKQLPMLPTPKQAKMEAIERKIVAPPTFLGLKGIKMLLCYLKASRC